MYNTIKHFVAFDNYITVSGSDTICFSLVASNETSSLPTTPLSDPTNATFHPDMKPPLGTCDQHMIATTLPTCSAGGVVILPSVVSSRNDLTMENIPGG